MSMGADVYCSICNNSKKLSRVESIRQQLSIVSYYDEGPQEPRLDRVQFRVYENRL